MNKIQLRNLLACPNCSGFLQFKRETGYCPSCETRIRQENGIWYCIGKLSTRTQSAQKKYDELFTQEFCGPTDGSYEILSLIARGNRCVDIACGSGMIEKMCPSVVGVDFSLTALKQAQKNGARFLVLADAQALPFRDNAFEIAISAGNLEHFDDPERALLEMARISKIQVLIVHRFPPVPFAKILFLLITKLFHIRHQPIERPVNLKQLEQMLTYAHLHVIFKGEWTFPLNYGRVIKWLPELKIFPSAWFIISIKK